MFDHFLQAQGRGSRVNFSSNSSLNVYRRVGIEQLCAQPKTGIYFEVSLSVLPLLLLLPLLDVSTKWRSIYVACVCLHQVTAMYAVG
jgi:hypothetical protein